MVLRQIQLSMIDPCMVSKHPNEPYQIQKGQRLFQICGRYLEPIHLNLVETLSDSERGNGGFGSTGS